MTMEQTTDFSRVVNNLAYGLDTTAALNNEPSIFDSLGNIVTKGAPLTALSVINSFYNTGVDVANWFGADASRISIADEIQDPDYLKWYADHQQGVETAGLIIGSFIPGGAAIKALKLAQLGKFGSVMQRATNIFAGPKDTIIQNAIKDIVDPNTVYNALTADKFKAIALGFGDQALQALAYETATVATMKASPLLDADGFGAVVENMFYGVLLGGGIGGVIEGIGVRAILNKALVKADTTTKMQEIATYLGGNKDAFIAGDRALVLLDSLYNIPETTSLLGSKKAAQTRDAGILNAKKILTGISENGDEQVSNTFINALLHMKDVGGIGKEEMYERLSRLSRISRITDKPAASLEERGTIFYVNDYAGQNKDFSTMITNNPDTVAKTSLSYRMREYATDVKVARFDDVMSVSDDITVPKYGTQQEAFDQGADIFINAKLEVKVNPNAPNIERVARPGESRILTKKEEMEFRKTGNLPEGSKQLQGAPLIFNTQTGAVSESAIAVVGDYGTPKLFDKGLNFGGKSSLQDLTSVITKDTETIDANARYVWFSERGVKAGDELVPNDPAALEQLYRQAIADKNVSYEQMLTRWEKQKITFSDASELPASLKQLEEAIKRSKDELIADLLQGDVAADEIAIRANVTMEYIENGLVAKSVKDIMQDVDKSKVINNVRLEYDIGNVYQQDGNILRGLIDTQYRIQLIQDNLHAAATNFFGEDVKYLTIKGKASDANITGVGAKGFSFSNANYGTLGQEIERVGRFVATKIQQLNEADTAKLVSPVNAIRNDLEASAELGNFIAVRRRTSENYVFLPDHLRAKYNMPDNTVVLQSSLKYDKAGIAKDWDQAHVPSGFIGTPTTAQLNVNALHTYYTLSPKVAAFERANLEINNKRIVSRNSWFAANGMAKQLSPDVLYAPAIDTNKYKFIALVKAREGYALGDDGVAVITAETAQMLETKIASLKDTYSIYTKSDLKKYHEVLGDYQYDRNFAQNAVNSDLQRRGILNNIFPDTRPESIISDYIDFHSKQNARLVRDFVETNNAQLFAELRAMGDKFIAAETSKTGFVPSFLGRSVPNPYNSYIRTATAVSDRETYRLWHESQEKLEAFASTAFRAARQAFFGAKKGVLSYEQAAAVSERFGLGNPYSTAVDATKAYYELANQLPPTRILSNFVSAANSMLAATTIRIDAFQSLINAVSTPILLAAESNSVRKLIEMELPDGSGRMIPATSKLMYKSIANYFDAPTREANMLLFKKLGVVRDRSSDYFQMINELQLPLGKISESEIAKRLEKAADIASKLALSDKTEEFVRYIAADSALQIFQAAGKSGVELHDNIITFVNRVHGNYIASQRPIAFQGPIGQAIGMFQTYQFNLMQQLFRHIENRDITTIGIMAALQTSIFGLQGMPGFQFINSHIIGNASGNPAHKDIYSTVPQLADKKLGDYLLYGVLSNWLNTGLYSRGDINPRQITVLPINPLDYPAISGGIKFIGNILDTAGNVANGGDIGTSILRGLEHNGISRPLSGLAQLVQGYTTTSTGSLVSTNRNNTMGNNEFINAANFARLLGARPLDEAIAMDAMYRTTLYKAKDAARIKTLGEAFKSKLYNNGQPSLEDTQKFASKYAASGGDIKMFGSKIIEWSKDANVSAANKIFSNLSDPLNQQMMIIMGGSPLPDFRTGPSLNTPSIP